MRLVALTLVVSGARSSGEPIGDFLGDVFWSVVRPGDGLEHLCVRAGPGRIDLGFYVRSPAVDEALATVRDLLRRAVAMSPLLGPWTGQAPDRLHAVDLTGIGTFSSEES
jgi:hypothetical protein